MAFTTDSIKAFDVYLNTSKWMKYSLLSLILWITVNILTSEESKIAKKEQNYILRVSVSGVYSISGSSSGGCLSAVLSGSGVLSSGPVR